MFDFTEYMDSWPKAIARLMFLFVVGHLVAVLLGASFLSIGTTIGSLVVPVVVATIAYQQKRKKRLN
ncbi:hypothetical protein [Vibrio coralliilyticus]|uniref:Uncharacterized protein n=1 Tax=Vibrio coralliilyticus TaxID=190893 RepID=A0AAP6ZQ11_9VIBR|nr:hypothetical protein [Vibrio coralliilyticus]NOI31873.1 hypothetical protein [Vibrio coralliilyticus]NOJ25317.1 hypothetical protein [Vibrio coralliilyticus]